MKDGQNGFDLNINGNPVFLRLDMLKGNRNRYHWDSVRHCNAEYELHVILSGACNVDVENGHYTMRGRQAIVIPPGHYHNSESLPGEFNRLSISFQPGGDLARHLREQLEECRIFGMTEQMEWICQKILDEYDNRGSLWWEMQGALLTMLMVTVLRLLRLDKEEQQTEKDADWRIRTDLIDEYFNLRFAEKLTLDQLAGLLNLSYRQVARILQEYYGMSFQEKLTSARMDHAAWLLRTTQLSADEIAGTVGYTSCAAFYQAFRRYCRMTPLQYRRQFLMPDKEEEAQDCCELS